MKQIILFPLFMSFLVIGLNAQVVEVEGKVNINVMDTVTDVSANVVRQSDGTLAVRQYQIGDTAQGGIVFYVDESGEHGLVADTANLVDTFRFTGGEVLITPWHMETPEQYFNTYATGDGPFAGEMNTALIITSMSLRASVFDTLSFAARLCADLQRGGYGDWYLPSKEELNLMYTNLQLAGIGGFVEGFYWSSTEESRTNAWMQDFSLTGTGAGVQDYLDKFNSGAEGMNVRAIRAF